MTQKIKTSMANPGPYRSSARPLVASQEAAVTLRVSQIGPWLVDPKPECHEAEDPHAPLARDVAADVGAGEKHCREREDRNYRRRAAPDPVPEQHGPTGEIGRAHV